MEEIDGELEVSVTLNDHLSSFVTKDVGKAVWSVRVVVRNIVGWSIQRVVEAVIRDEDAR